MDRVTSFMIFLKNDITAYSLVIDQQMKFAEFQHMSISERLRVIDEEAVYLCSVPSVQGEFSLFQLHEFYVEVFYPIHYYEESLVTCFNDTELLKPYLDIIDVSAVYSFLNSH